MRMSKRLAVGVLAAAMALSMMTACGGTSGGNTGGSSSSGKPGQNTSSSGSSSSSSASSGSETGNDKDNTQISSKNSRAAKYFNRREKMTRYTYKVQIESESSNGSSLNQTLKVVTDGVRDYLYVKGSGGSSDEFTSITDKKTKMVSIVPKKSDGSDEKVVYQYNYADADIDMDYSDPQYIENIAMIGDPRKSSYPITVGTTMVDGTLYYSETYGYDVGAGTKWIYCFDAGDLEGNNLRYVIKDSQFPQMTGIEYDKMKIKIIEDTPTIDYKLLQVPEGYEIMIYKEDNGTWWEHTKETTPKDNYPN